VAIGWIFLVQIVRPYELVLLSRHTSNRIGIGSEHPTRFLCMPRLCESKSQFNEIFFISITFEVHSLHMQLHCDFGVPEGLLRRRVTQWNWDLARGGNFPFSRLEFQRSVWGLVVKYSMIFMVFTEDTHRFFPIQRTCKTLLTFLLTPWSRVLLEKLTSKLGS